MLGLGPHGTRCRGRMRGERKPAEHLVGRLVTALGLVCDFCLPVFQGWVWICRQKPSTL